MMKSATLSFRRALLAPLMCLTALLSAPAQAATFQGEFFASSSSFANINQAVAAISGQTPTATFISTAIDYPNGNQNIQFSNQSLGQFLGADAASLVGDPTQSVTTSVFRFTGFVELTPGQQTFALGSDDGYRLSLNNTVVSEQSAPRAFRFTTLDTDVGTGVVPFELVFYENFGRTGVEFFIDNALATPAAVPLPATASLGLLGFAALFGLRRRKGRKMGLAPAT